MKTLKYSFPTADSRDKHFFVLSDLHIARAHDTKKLDAILGVLTKKEKYDAIFLVGDLINSTDTLKDDKLTDHLINFIRALGSLSPTYIAVGNHDVCSYKKIGESPKKWRRDDRRFTEEFLNRIKTIPNIHVRDREIFEIGDNYTVSIFNPPIEFVDKTLKSDLSFITKKSSSFAFLQKLDPNKTNILLCHYPDVLKQLHRVGLLENVDLAIAGHNHNGMTQFLLIEPILSLIGQPNRGIVTPEKSFKKSDTSDMRGLIKLDEKTHLLINPAYTSLSANTFPLNLLNCLFYKGSSLIAFEKK